MTTGWVLACLIGESKATGGKTDSADVSAASNVPVSSGNEVISSPPPPPQAGVSTTPSETASVDEVMSAEHNGTSKTDEASETEATEVAPEQEKGETMQTPSDQPDTAASTNGFPVLSIGTKMLRRYEITQVISENSQEHVYQVVDHQGYQHCWNCGSEQNATANEFCITSGPTIL